MIVQNLTVDAYLAIVVDVGMEELGFELKNWWFVGILFCKIYPEPECAALPNGIEWAVNDCLPLVHVVFIRHSVNALVIALL